MDFSTAGLKDGALRLGKVLLYVAISAVVAELITIVGNWTPTTIEFITLQGVINAILAGLKVWLSTSK